MKHNKILRDYFPNYLTTEALFTQMSVLGAPWPSEVGQDMDDAYFTMYSGIKNASEFVRLHLNPDSEIANALTIARILYSFYGANWTRLWEAYKTKYVPINNYDVQETVSRTETNDRTINRTNNLDSTVDGTLQSTTDQNGTQNLIGKVIADGTTDSNGTSALEHGLQVKRDMETDSYTFAFNSQEKVPTAVQIDSGTDVNSGTDTTTTSDHSASNTTTNTNNDTTDSLTSTTNDISKDTRTDKTVEDTLDTDDIKEDIQRTRQGNIGQNSYQDLLRQEFELWRWNFFTQVFKDVDKFLTLSVYGC